MADSTGKRAPSRKTAAEDEANPEAVTEHPLPDEDDDEAGEPAAPSLVGILAALQHSLGPALSGLVDTQSQSVLILKKHLLRAQEEVVRGFLAVIEEEIRRTDRLQKARETPERSGEKLSIEE